jgi:hypothetical protein
MADVTEAVVAELAVPVAAAMPALAARIPPRYAAELGRLGVSPGTAGPGSGMPHGGVPPRVAAADESPVIGALRSITPLDGHLAAALDTAVQALDLDNAPDLASYLGEPPARLTVAHVSTASPVVTAAAFLDRLRPGAAGLTATLARRLAGNPLIASLLAVSSDELGPSGTRDAMDEAAIASAHGAAYLALAVAVARAVAGSLLPPAPIGGPMSVVGVAIGATVLLLRDLPMPAGYEAARLAKVQAEYRLPHSATGSVPVSGHRFALAEGGVPDAVDFSGNGLVAVVPGGAVIRTGAAAGSVHVRARVFDEPPPLDTRAWDEVVEVSWHATAGLASVSGLDAAGGQPFSQLTPPWPGSYRLRVHASGRDDADRTERYQLDVWAAPAAPEITRKHADRLGYRLRGEPEPARPPAPERAYRWIDNTELSEAATITVVTGSSVDDVLRAFGADPTRPASPGDAGGVSGMGMTDEPWVAVLDAGAAVLAVEYNGYKGADEAVLARASAHGRAASMFWNVNGLTTLSFAEGGQVLASFEPGLEPVPDAGPAVAAVLDGLDFEDYRDMEGKGLVAVERFTGRGFTAADLERIEAAGIAFQINP